MITKKKVLFLANSDWYLYNFRLPLINDLIEQGYKLHLFAPLGKYEDELRSLNAEVNDATLSRGANQPLNDLKFLFKLRNYLVSEQIETLHSFTLKSCFISSIASYKLNVNLVQSITGLGYLFINNSFINRLRLLILKPFFRFFFNKENAKFIFQNLDDQQLFIDSGFCNASQAYLIKGSGVDCKKFQPRVRKYEDSNCTFLFPSRILIDKGILEFLHASKKLKENKVNTNFIIAGDHDFSNPSSVSEAEIKKWMHLNIFNFIGHVHNMHEIFQKVDVVVLPSYREGLSKALAEAAASGLPIITTDVPGCRDVVEDNYNGYLVKPMEIESLYECMYKLSNDVQIRKNFGLASRLIAENIFNVEIINKLTKKLYL